MDTGYPTDFLGHYKSEMEKRMIEQAQGILRNYGLLPPITAPIQQPGQGGNMITIPVSSMEQANNAPVDAFRIFIFPNIEAGEIYVKKIGDDGKVIIQTYSNKGVDKMFEESTSRVLFLLDEINGKIDNLPTKGKEKDKTDE